MDKEIVHIYRICFPTSDKCYIGQTNDIKSRMLDHLRGTKGWKSLVHNALIKYDDWDISVLHTCQTRDEANRVEIEEIRNFNSVHPNGYNLSAGGSGCTPCDETRKKISKSLTGKIRSAESRAAQSLAQMGRPGWWLGKHPSEETRRKLSKAQAGEKNSFYGKHHDDSTKEKIRSKLAGRKRDKHAVIKMAITVRRNHIERLKQQARDQGVDINRIIIEEQ